MGWHHHVSIVLASDAAVVTCQVRGFPPRREGQRKLVRSQQRPGRHVHDSFETVRVALGRRMGRWLREWRREHLARRRRVRPPALAQVA